MTVIKQYNSQTEEWEAIAVGQKGDTGEGVAAGGTEFQLLEKASGTDFDTRWTSVATVKGLQLDTADPAAPATGRIIWNDGDQVPQFVSNGKTVNISLETLARCRNVTGSLIPKGTAVCIVGASANRISIAPSDRTQPGSACRTLGLTAEDIPNNNLGKVSTFGLVKGLNTNAFDEGDELFVGATPGSLSATPPDSPARRLVVGYVVTKNPSQGQIFVTLRRGVRVSEIDDVQITTIANNDIIRYNSANARFENVQLDKNAVGLGNVDNTSDATKNSATATLTNKTVNLTDNTLTGTLSQFNTALSDGSFVSLAGAETLTNKTLTSPAINTPTIAGGTIDNMPIGGTTASTGNFTNLAYTGTLTGGTGEVNLGSGQFVKFAGGNVNIGGTTGSPFAGALRTVLQILGSSIGVVDIGNNTGDVRMVLEGNEFVQQNVINAVDAPLVMQTDSTERMRITSAGAIQLPSGSPGIKFGTRNNNLDDYETGTWTPAFTAFSNCSSISLNQAIYIKIGNFVNYHILGSLTVTSANQKAEFGFTQAFAQSSLSDAQGGSAMITGPSNVYASGHVVDSSGGDSSAFVAVGASALDFNGSCVFNISGSFRAG